MMKKQLFVLAVFCVFFISLSITSKVEATVGGETLIHTFTYNPSNESIYFIMQSQGGRGCPPELHKLSLNTGKTDVVYSCNEGEKISNIGGDYNSQTVLSVINGLSKDFKPLTPLNFKNNNISINIKFDSEQKFTEIDEVMFRRFTASVYQNNVKVADFPVTGCSIDQPFLFQGYAIPGYNKRIALLLSAKGDCFEGGYIRESLYSITGVDNLNKTVDTNFYKGLSALTPNEGNLVVYQSGSINAQTFSIRQFIELLIQIGVITSDKANTARAIFGF